MPSELGKHRNALRPIVKIEESFDTNSLTYRNVKFWPLVRFALHVSLAFSIGAGKERQPNSREAEGASHPSKFFRRISRIPSKYLNALRAHNSQMALLKTRDPQPLLFLTRQYDYRLDYNGLPYNTFMDPLIELCNSPEGPNYHTLGLASSPWRQEGRNFESVLQINPQPKLEMQGIKHSFKNKPAILNGYDGLQKTLDSLGIHALFGERDILRRLDMILDLASCYKDILKILKPKALLLNCYYTDINLAAIIACRDMGITSVDVQHGAQNFYSPAYHLWSAPPAGGFSLLPDLFWCWSSVSAARIKYWHPSGYKHHTPIVGGYPWLARVESYADGMEDPHADYLSSKFNQHKLILFSAQPLAHPFPDILTEGIRQSPSDWVWLLRLHPNQGIDPAQLEASFRNQGMHNVEVVHTTKCNLYKLLSLADCHITRFSIVYVEAIPFGLGTISIDSHGDEYFEGTISSGVVKIAHTVDELLDLASSDEIKVRPQQVNEFVEMRPAIALEHLRQLAGRI